MTDSEIIRLLLRLAVHTLGGVSDAFRTLLLALQQSASMHAILAKPAGFQQLLPFAALLADSPELLPDLGAWLPTGSGQLATVLPFVLLLGMSQATTRQAMP